MLIKLKFKNQITLSLFLPPSPSPADLPCHYRDAFYLSVVMVSPFSVSSVIMAVTFLPHHHFYFFFVILKLPFHFLLSL